jgi:NTE family protein
MILSGKFHFTPSQSLQHIVLVFVLVCFSSGICSQKVGVVLSGGGATAMAHIGFLKVLEENEIPIDYIGGTSMGALIAAMYATGYSTLEIDSIVRTDEFRDMASGELNDSLKFYFKHAESDASFVSLKYSKGKIITNAIPTNLINPVLLDWNLMAGFSQADAASNNNFDSLFIPFRCIAADIEHKKQVVFKNGPLNIATRASCTYPFYLPPIRVDGALLYDGGIYNNFPSNLIYYEFLPDVIIGCNVSGETTKPSEDDLFSQLQSMILFREEFVQLCDNMIVIKPDVQDIGTFDFDKIEEAIERGSKITEDSLPGIRKLITRRVGLTELSQKRAQFRNKFRPFIIEDILINGLDKGQKNYVRKMMGRKSNPEPIGNLKREYFRIFDDDKIKSIFPLAQLNPASGYFRLLLDLRKEKDLMLSFGGNYSSRSINSGYIGLRYNIFGKSSSTISANSYFGRFYGSVSANIRYDISASNPFSAQLGFTLNRWDFYRSFATFFEDVKPSFIVMNERFGNLTLTIPAGNRGTIRNDIIYTYQFDQYYQTTAFKSVDTTDKTIFASIIDRMVWERNTLNRKQFANAGTNLTVSAKFLYGQETTIPGSTSPIKDTIATFHNWIVLKANYLNYFSQFKRIKFGFLAEGVLSTQDFFTNYIASSIAAPAFAPIPESKTFFMPQYRAHKYAATGIIAVLSFSKMLDLRAEAYVFKPFGQIKSNILNKAEYDNSPTQLFILSSSLVFHSPIGPLAFSANYYDKKENPWSLVLNFGYILFNKSSRD